MKEQSLPYKRGNVWTFCQLLLLRMYGITQTPKGKTKQMEDMKIMKRYKVYFYNTQDKFWDCYEVNAIDPVDARNVAVQRLVDETGHGLDINELTDVCEVKE